MNQKRHFVPLGFAALLIVGGCAAPRVSPEGPEPRLLGRDIRAWEAPERVDAQAQPPDPEEPSGPIGLRDALALALLRSPRLASSSWEVRAREALALQAGLRPNPEVSVELENFAGSGELGGVTSLETTVSLSQLIELGGKRAGRLHVAEFERDLALWDYEARRMDVLTGTTKAFVAVLAAQAQVSLAGDLVSVAEVVLGSVAARVRAGAASPVEESRARVALATSRIELETANHELTVRKNRLAATWGGTGARFSEARGSLDPADPPPSLDDLLGRIRNNPDLARWATEMARRKATLARERTLGVPDLTVGAGVRRVAELELNALVVEASLPLPLFDRNQGSVREAGYRLAQAEADRRAAEVLARADLLASHEALSAAFDEIEALRDDILPEAQRSFDGAQDAYRKGLFRFTDVLDTHRTLFELRGRYSGALARYHQIIADMERLVGEPLGSPGPENGRP